MKISVRKFGHVRINVVLCLRQLGIIPDNSSLNLEIMTTMKIVREKTRKALDNKINICSETRAKFYEIIDENQGGTLWDTAGVIDEVIESIDEYHEEDEYGDYPTLTKNELEQILFDVI